MHSNGMRAARLLTVSQHALPGGVSLGVSAGGRGCLPGDGWVSAWEGVYQGGLPVVGGGVADTSPREQTDTCENITFANFVCGR